MGQVWQVDAADCVTLDEATERLNVPAILTEAAFLKCEPADWTEFRGMMESMKGAEFAPDQSAHGLVHLLRHEGRVEVERREAKKASFIRRVPDSLEQGGVRPWLIAQTIPLASYGHGLPSSAATAAG